MSQSPDAAVATPPTGIDLIPAAGPSAPAGAAVLTVSIDGNVVQVVSLTSDPLTIGRLPDNGVVLSHQAVSRRHAEIRLEGSQAVLTDVGSSSGTQVGELRLKPNEPVALSSGDAAKIGPYVLTYAVVETGAAVPIYQRLGPPAPPPAPAPAPAEPVLEPMNRRVTFPVPLPAGPRSRYARHLPGLYQDNDFMARMLLIFEAIWEPLEQRQDHFPLYFAPSTCPAGLLPWLASWLNLSLDQSWPEPRQRALLGEAMDLYRWRGTPYGLVRMIEVCTGLTPFITEDPKQPYVFRVAVRIPPNTRVRPELIEEIVAQHKPAHVGYILEVTSS
jgi:phage tail-like protein